MQLRKLRRILTVLLLAAGLAAAAAPAAHASSGTQLCYFSGVNACLNAWSGGPYVKVYETRGNPNNNFFTYVAGDGANVIQFEGSGAYGGLCAGDALNQSGRADAYLDGCPGPLGSGNNGGWGVNFTEYTSGCPSGEAGFYNRHWGGWLSPANNYVTGSPFYLNSSTEVCFSYTTF